MGEIGLRSAHPKSFASSARPSSQEFRELVEAHQSRVFSIAFRILEDRWTAEEVAQDVFLALYKDLDRLESEEHVLAWLRRVTVHRAIDAHRHRASRVDFTAEEFCEERTIVASEIDASPSIASRRVEYLIATLSPTQRAILLLRYQEDMLPTEIATTLAMPLGTVKSHLQRALKLLRAKAARLQKEVAHG